MVTGPQCEGDYPAWAGPPQRVDSGGRRPGISINSQWKFLTAFTVTAPQAWREMQREHDSQLFFYMFGLLR
ncbi:protein of unknown function (plasmid) [Methylocella tundrae]|uniref:Uncharacterized protein n=1 Tax=Methylocella tundrae TaxID=227605 RepID=A0A4U8Z7W0_METTU|nr:protein of unknown function [Methylocella tundrae]